MHKNNLKTIRSSEGVNITELANLSKVSAKVISETERGLRDPRLETKHKIIKGLNLIKNKFKDYTFIDIFPVDLTKS